MASGEGMPGSEGVPLSGTRGPEEVFAEHLLRRARTYFEAGHDAAPEVIPGWRRVRAGSALYKFDIRMGRHERQVLVKVLRTRPRPRPQNGASKPSLGRGLEPTRRCRMEYEILAALDDHIRGLEDPRFGAVRAYDVLPAERALVLEFLPQPSLRDLILPWPLAGFADVPGRETLFRNAGAWLKMYHDLIRPTPPECRHAGRGDFIEFTAETVGFLVRTVGPSSWFRQLAARVERAARTHLPRELPLGLSHGDYAMRNVLVGPAGAVSVIDTDGRWRAPIYEDIGHLLTDVKLNKLQLISRGRLLGGRIRAYERAFLEGYFGGEIPMAEIRLYEIQACLDRWAANVARRGRAGKPAPRMIQAARLRLASGYFRKVIDTHLDDLGCARSEP